MPIQPHQGILNIPNATLRVGKLAVDSTAGFDTFINVVERNTTLLEDVTIYSVTKQWDLKLPNIFVATFEIQGISSFNFHNTSDGTAANGYTLLFNGTSLKINYDNAELATATIPNLDSTYGKVYVTFEKKYITVTINGTRYLTYEDTQRTLADGGKFINFFNTSGAFKNLKIVAGNWISDGTSNVVLMGGKLGIGTDTPEDTLHVNGGIRFAGHIIPTTNATFDIGSADKKVRDMYVDDNSLWIGDQTKITFESGKMKFKRRKLNKVPRMVKDLAIEHGRADEADVETHAIAFAHAVDSTITTVAQLKLEHWRDYTKTFDSTKAISDIFANNVEDYEAVTASEAFAEVGSDIYSTHNISIGKTTAPTSKLDVAGTVTATAAIFSGDVAVNTNTLFVDSSANSVGLGTVTPSANLHVTGNVYVSSNLEVGTANLFVDTVNSRVGVGKTNPDTALDVVGTVTATALVGTNLYGTLLGSNAASVSSLTASGTVKGTDLIGTNLYGTLLGSNAASVSSLTASGTVKGAALTGTNLYGTLLGSNAASVSSLTASGDVAFDTNTLFVDSTENRVGIGTTSPGSRLHVYDGTGTVASQMSLGPSAASDTAGIVKYFHGDGSGTGYMIMGNWGDSMSGGIGLVVKKGGNVGIGTTSPNAKLQVNGDIQLNDPEQPIGFGIYHGTHSTLDYFDTLLAKSLRRTADTTFEMQSDGNHAGFSAMDMQFRDIRFYTGTTASPSAVDVNITDLPSYERMCITTTGNVGIGTNVPATALEVNGDIGIGRVAGGYTFREVVGGGVRATIKSNATNDLILSTGGDSEALRILTNGNVGIGTTTPDFPLTIQETTTNTNTVTYPLALRAISSGTVDDGFGVGLRFQCERRDTDDYNGQAGSVEVYGTNIPGTGDRWNMRFGVRNDDTAVTPMTLQYDGNVGIGTVSPAYTLDVNGLASSKTSRVFEFSGGDTHARHFWICSFLDAPGNHTNTLIKINYSVTYKRTSGSHSRNSIASGTVTFSDLWRYSTNASAGNAQYYTLQDQKNELYYGQGRLPKWYYVRFNGIGYLVLSASISDGNSAAYYVKGNVDYMTRPGADSSDRIFNGTVYRDSSVATTEGFTAISSLYPTTGTDVEGWDTSMASGSTAQTFLEATEGTIFKYGNVGIGTSSPTVKLEVNGSIKSGTYMNGSNPHVAALDVRGGGSGSEQQPVAIVNSYAESDTIIFCDRNPWVSFAFVHENSSNDFLITSGGSTNEISNHNVRAFDGTQQVAYIKHRFDVDDAHLEIGGLLKAGLGNGGELISFGTKTGQAAVYMENANATNSWGGYPGFYSSGEAEMRWHGSPDALNIRADGWVHANNGFSPFTGVHTCNSYFSEDRIGLIVCADGDYCTDDKEGKAWFNDIKIMNTSPLINLCSKEKDKSVFGVVGKIQNTYKKIEFIRKLDYDCLPADQKELYDPIVTGYNHRKTQQEITIEEYDALENKKYFKPIFEQAKAINYDGSTKFQVTHVNSLGEGGMWVTNKSGIFENGDYITSSSVPGYGQKQDDDLLHNYTVAKITTDCDFTKVTYTRRHIQQIDGIHQYDENNNPIYINELDENENIVTDLKFKLRYLLPNGTQISEEEYTARVLDNENVYIAAFVGCTYHCG